MDKVPCVGCRRAVGSVFSVTRNGAARTFIAKCGDASSPCPLDIQFIVADRINYARAIAGGQSDINDIKTRIIIGKNNMLFDYSPDANATEWFSDLSEQLEETAQATGKIVESNIMINDNPENIAELETFKKYFVDEVLWGYNNMIEKYKQDVAVGETSSDNVPKTLAQYYIDDIAMWARDINNLEYPEMFVEHHNNRYILIQQQNPETNYFFNASDDKIITNTEGARPKPKSRTLSAAKKTPKNTTLKASK